MWGYCRTKQDFRMFKLNRMDGLKLAEEQIHDREIPFPEFEIKTFFPSNVHLKAVFEPSMRWQLIENYGPSSFLIQEDGSLCLKWTKMRKDLLPGFCHVEIKLRCWNHSLCVSVFLQLLPNYRKNIGTKKG